MTIFVNLLILTWGLKKRGQQNKVTLILKWGLRHLLRTSTQGSGKYQADAVSLFFRDKKE